MKIFSEDEEHQGYSESYEVKFTFKDTDGFWKQGKKFYFTCNKGRHEQVAERWKRDYKGKEVKLINVVYQ